MIVRGGYLEYTGDIQQVSLFEFDLLASLTD